MKKNFFIANSNWNDTVIIIFSFFDNLISISLEDRTALGHQMIEKKGELINGELKEIVLELLTSTLPILLVVSLIFGWLDLETVKDLNFMSGNWFTYKDQKLYVTRSGYTGEDGFEISMPGDQAERIAKLLLSDQAVEWVGLGARDSLRLEAGLSLYGHELDEQHSPVESSLTWALSKTRRLGGERPGISW